VIYEGGKRAPHTETLRGPTAIRAITESQALRLEGKSNLPKRSFIYEKSWRWRKTKDEGKKKPGNNAGKKGEGGVPLKGVKGEKAEADQGFASRRGTNIEAGPGTQETGAQLYQQQLEYL